MIIDLTDVVWLDEQHEVSIEELAQLSGLTIAELEQLIDYGALVPAQPERKPQVFHSGYIVSVKTAGRLRDAFELDTSALSLALQLLERIHRLEDRLRKTEAALPPDKRQ